MTPDLFPILGPLDPDERYNIIATVCITRDTLKPCPRLLSEICETMAEGLLIELLQANTSP